MRTTNNLIRDGQTRKHRIAAVPGLHEGLDFEYRPLMPSRFKSVEMLLAEYEQSGKADESVAVIAGVLGEKVTGWSESEDPTPENWKRMPFGLLKEAYNAICGFRPSDEITNDADAEAERLRLMEQRASADGVAESIKN